MKTIFTIKKKIWFSVQTKMKTFPHKLKFLILNTLFNSNSIYFFIYIYNKRVFKRKKKNIFIYFLLKIPSKFI